MAQRLGNVAVGSVVKLKENGTPQEYLVVHQGLPGAMYDASCNGTWLLKSEIPQKGPFDRFEASYSGSDIDKWMNNEFLSKIDPELQPFIKEVRIPFCVSGGSNSVQSGSSGWKTKVFPLSTNEVGYTNAALPIDGVRLSYFSSGGTSKLIFNFNGIPSSWYTRTTTNKADNGVSVIQNNGIGNPKLYYETHGYLPAFIMQTDLIVDDDGNIVPDTYPEPPTSITVPTEAVPNGSTVAVSWDAVTGATYSLQRSADGGSWEDIYTGGNNSYSDTAGIWNKVKYRVASVKSGITSGYTTSSDVTILPYTITSFTVPSQVMSGQSIPISWSQVQAANTYVLERKVDSGEWTQVYKGSDTSFTDSTGTWSTVQYRVKAGADEVYGSYKESEVIPVISASALVISGTDGDLGTLNKDVPYTVSSDTGNPITLERYVNGNLVTKITVQSGFAYSVPVLELPTGTGTIKLVCSVNTSSGGPVTATRIWGYTKAVVNFPTEGAPSVITKEGKIAFPISLAECIKVPVNFGGSLDKALELIFPLLNTAVMETGSYEGTGTFGSSNPNKLTFNFNVEIVIISGSDGSLTISNKEPSGGQSDGYIEGQEVTWYSTSAANQFNVQGEIYSYWAVGKAVS